MKTSDKYALISVFDKTGIVELAKQIDKLGYNIISTGGTAKILTENNIKVIPIQEITKNPESFDGRMKTISFQIESGILFDRSNQKHIKEAKELNIHPIDLVVCNLYPFEQTIAKQQTKLEDAIENIDVGGPTMIQAAAKNFKNVLVIVDPNDYAMIISALEENGITRELRQKLAAKAFAHISFYDSQIARYLGKETFPENVTIPGKKLIELRYGENPHQSAAVYTVPNSNSPFANLKKLWGRDLSLTNVTDINAGLESVTLFNEPTAVVIKHNSPCGIALGTTIHQALDRAIDADPESAFGGVIIVNKNIDMRTAHVISAFKKAGRGNFDIIASPTIDDDALALLQTLRKSMGIYTFENIKTDKNEYNIKSIIGGFALQTRDDDLANDFSKWEIVTKKQPTKEQTEQMKIAWKFLMRIRSNAIIVVDKNLPMTRGIGSGQTSRLRSTKIALEQAGKYTIDGILASDSFFPFDDSVVLAGEKHIGAIVQQGGSINDKASIDRAEKLGIPMVFTHHRAFWH